MMFWVGLYFFIVRATTVDFGAHKAVCHFASLQTIR